MIPFLKMQGCGNDFVVFDERYTSLPALNWQQIADRHYGIGCDTIMLLSTSEKADVRARFINADGSESSSCGNALRCAAALLHRESPHLSLVRIETNAGIVTARVEGKLVTVDMGEPRLEWQEIPLAQECDTLMLPLSEGELSSPSAVSMGNPHAVFFVENADAVPLAQLGPKLEHHPLFPQRANIEVAQILSPTEIKLHVWERGVGLTLACGTGACATLVSAHRRGLAQRKATLHLPGGDLIIEWREEDSHVLMSGEAVLCFEGSYPA